MWRGLFCGERNKLGFEDYKLIETASQETLPYMSCNMRKHTFEHVYPGTIQISLPIHAVWSESSLCAFWITKDTKFLHANNKDWSDCANVQADLSLSWAHKLEGTVSQNTAYMLHVNWKCPGLPLYLYNFVRDFFVGHTVLELVLPLMINYNRSSVTTASCDWLLERFFSRLIRKFYF